MVKYNSISHRSIFIGIMKLLSIDNTSINNEYLLKKSMLIKRKIINYSSKSDKNSTIDKIISNLSYTRLQNTYMDMSNLILICCIQRIGIKYEDLISNYLLHSYNGYESNALI
ncbi:hypothetical protein SLOPH_1055 [Spraguea lophii 42_110]|uniref:Uncharacterized protein n=1 Tax=Spraguea lophii (strain 42_110) TaxID=1358809 RepID=S7WA89_SPRLO|nr:hypothetical protein SLOPH_1055 [Spraguea lophii 42_110]